MAGAYCGFCGMKRATESIATPLWMGCLFITGLSLAVRRWYPFIRETMWRETMWGKLSCLGKQHNGMDWAFNQQPSDLRSSSALNTTPPYPPLQELCRGQKKRGWEAGFSRWQEVEEITSAGKKITQSCTLFCSQKRQRGRTRQIRGRN